MSGSSIISTEKSATSTSSSTTTTTATTAASTTTTTAAAASTTAKTISTTNKTNPNDQLISNLLVANIRSGTLAFVWCFKTQFVRRLSKYFYRWRSNIHSSALNPPLLPSIPSSLNRSNLSAINPDDPEQQQQQLANVSIDEDYESYRLQLLSFAQNIISGSANRDNKSSNNNSNKNISSSSSSNNNDNSSNHTDMFRHVVVDDEAGRDTRLRSRPRSSLNRNLNPSNSSSVGSSRSSSNRSSKPMNRSLEISPSSNPVILANKNQNYSNNDIDYKRPSRSLSTDNAIKMAHMYKDRHHPFPIPIPIPNNAVLSNQTSRPSHSAANRDNIPRRGLMMPTRSFIGGTSRGLDNNSSNNNSNNSNNYINNSNIPSRRDSNGTITQQRTQQTIQQRSKSASPMRRRGGLADTLSGGGGVGVGGLSSNTAQLRDNSSRSMRSSSAVGRAPATSLAPPKNSTNTTRNRNSNNNYNTSSSSSSNRLNTSLNTSISSITRSLVAEYAASSRKNTHKTQSSKSLNYNNSSSSNNNNNNNNNNLVKPAVDVVRVRASQSSSFLSLPSRSSSSSQARNHRRGEATEIQSVSTISTSSRSQGGGRRRAISNDHNDRIDYNDHNGYDDYDNQDGHLDMPKDHSIHANNSFLNLNIEPESLISLAEKGVSLSEFSSPTRRRKPALSEADDVFSEGVSEITNDLSILNSAKKQARPQATSRNESSRAGSGGGGVSGVGVGGRTTSAGRGLPTSRRNPLAPSGRAGSQYNSNSNSINNSNIINNNNYNKRSAAAISMTGSKVSTDATYQYQYQPASYDSVAFSNTSSTRLGGSDNNKNYNNTTNTTTNTIRRTSSSARVGGGIGSVYQGTNVVKSIKEMEPAQYRLIYGTEKPKEKKWGDTLRKI